MEIDLATLLSILLGIISIIVSIIFYILGNNSKKIIYTKQSDKIITENISEIEGLNILYHDTPIKNLLYTTINIKCSGKDTIDMNDFSEPLYIKTNGKFFIQDLKTILTNNSRPTNNIEFSLIDNSTIQLKYKLFKYKDIITLNIYHTGNLELTGELKNGEIINSNSINKKSVSDVLTITGLIIGIIFIVLASFIANGYEFYISEALKFVLNFGLGISLIDFYHKTYKNSSK